MIEGPTAIIVIVVFSIIYALLDEYHDYAMLKWKDSIALYTATKDSYYLSEYKRWDNNWHRADFVIKFLVVALICVLLFGFTFAALQYLILGGLIRWLLFDLTHNLRRGLPADYVGTVADTDILLRKIGISQILLKSIFIIITIVWIIIS